MRTLIFVTMTALSGLCLVVKTRALYADRANVFLRALWATLALVFVASVLGIPVVLTSLEQTTGVPALWVVLPAAGSVAAARSMLLLWADPPDTARRKVSAGLAVFAAAATAMIGLTLASRGAIPAAEAVSRQDAPELLWASIPGVRDAFLVYCTFMIASYADIALRLARTARLVDRRWLRRSMWTLFTSSLLLGAYSAAVAGYFVTYRFGVNLPQLQTSGVLSAGIGNVAAIAGFLTPVLGPRWDRLLAYRRLDRLWRTLGRTAPDLILDKPQPRLLDDWNPWRSDFRLYRRVIEIQDGIHLLRPYFRPEVAATARRLGQQANLTGRQLDTVIAAAQLHAAILDRNTGAEPHDRHPMAISNDDRASLNDELAILVPLARCFTSSPIAQAAASARHTINVPPG